MDIYADEGKTGTSVKSRKDFQRMIRQCRRGKTDLILTKFLSRFARNTLDTAKYTCELRQLGIPVIFEKDDLWTEKVPECCGISVLFDETWCLECVAAVKTDVS